MISMTKKKKYRWKFNKDPVKVRQIGFGENCYWQVATGGDFRKGYITYSNKEFLETFEEYK